VLPELERLIRLQEVESKAADARQRIAEAPARIAALDATLNDARAAVEAARTALAANQTTRREWEKEGATAQQRVAKYKDQLMEVKTNREYHAIQHEIATFSAEVQRFETLILEKMIEADEIAATLRTAETTLASQTKALGEERAAIEQEARELEGVVAAMASEREAIAKQLPADLLATFNTVLKNRRGVAVARVEGGLCAACHVRVRPQVLNDLLKGETILTCDSCQRILYVVAPKPAQSLGTSVGRGSEVG
jgi:predicted  nucleic acid-binding Zn-ribbon protein